MNEELGSHLLSDIFKHRLGIKVPMLKFQYDTDKSSAS